MRCLCGVVFCSDKTGLAHATRRLAVVHSGSLTSCSTYHALAPLCWGRRVRAVVWGPVGWLVTRFDASGWIGAVKLIQSLLCCAVLCRAVPCRAVLCCAVLCCAVLCCAVLCCIVDMKQKCSDLPHCCPLHNLIWQSLAHFADLIRCCRVLCRS